MEIYSFYLPGQKKSFREKLLKFSISFLFLGWFIGLVCGYGWRYKQVEPYYQGTIQELKKRINYYRENWMPMKPGSTEEIYFKKQKEINKPKQEAKGWRPKWAK